MTNGRRLPLKRTLAAFAAAAFTSTAIVLASASPAAAVEYQMTCGDYWVGGSNSSWGETVRYRSSSSSCSVHYAWVDVYYATSSGAGNTGKSRSSSQATTSNPATVHLNRTGTYKAWHSGCESGCHAEWS